MGDAGGVMAQVSKSGLFSLSSNSSCVLPALLLPHTTLTGRHLPTGAGSSVPALPPACQNAVGSFLGYPLTTPFLCVTYMKNWAKKHAVAKESSAITRTIIKQEAMDLKSGEGYMGQFGGKEKKGPESTL